MSDSLRGLQVTSEREAAVRVGPEGWDRSNHKEGRADRPSVVRLLRNTEESWCTSDNRNP